VRNLFAAAAAATIALAVCAACSDATVDDTGVGAQCTENGGRCVLGNTVCEVSAPTAVDDCNPDVNPGGGHCCLSVAAADAGATD
jgi:hypothetical protein